MAVAGAAGRYTTVNGIRLYYEVHGQGRPLVALHGGMGASEMFEPLLPALAGRGQVIAVHLQGHGLTPDADRPLRFETMADDVAALVGQLGLDQVDVLGYSLGGGAGYQMAIRHPDTVRRLVVVSEAVRRSGWYPEVAENMSHMPPELGAIMKGSPLAGLYPAVDWGRLVGKLDELLARDYDWSADVAKLQMPVMAVFADADAIQPAHVVEVYGLLGGGRGDAGLDGSGRPSSRLAVLPGMTHYNVLQFPGLAAIVSAFLE